VRFPFISHQIIALTKFLSYAFFPHRWIWMQFS
jgi:hypothetical protein